MNNPKYSKLNEKYINDVTFLVANLESKSSRVLSIEELYSISNKDKIFQIQVLLVGSFNPNPILQDPQFIDKLTDQINLTDHLGG